MRHQARRIAVVVGAFVVAGLVAGACSDDGVIGPAPTSTSAPIPAAGGFTASSFDVLGPASPADSVERARSAVLATLDAYLRGAVLQPLAGGSVGDLAPLFSAAAGERLSGPDRPVLVDESLVGPPGRPPQLASAEAALVGLSAADGQISVVSAHIEFKVVVPGRPQSTVVARRGDLVLVEDPPASGSWKIDSYDLVAGRAVTDAQATA